MKYVILTMSLLTGMPLHAANSNTTLTGSAELTALANPEQSPTVASTPVGNGPLLFDTYAAETGLQAIEATADGQTPVIAQMGNQLITAATQAPAGKPIATADTVVRNTLTGELGILTGRLHIVSNNAALLQQLTQRYGLKSVKSLRNGKVQLLEAPAGADLVQLLQQIRLEQGVQAARLDVLENLNTPQ